MDNLAERFMSKQYESENLADEAIELGWELESKIKEIVNADVNVSLGSNYILTVEISPFTENELKEELQEKVDDLFCGEPITNEVAYDILILEYDLQE